MFVVGERRIIGIEGLGSGRYDPSNEPGYAGSFIIDSSLKELIPTSSFGEISVVMRNYDFDPNWYTSTNSFGPELASATPTPTPSTFGWKPFRDDLKKIVFIESVARERVRIHSITKRYAQVLEWVYTNDWSEYYPPADVAKDAFRINVVENLNKVVADDEKAIVVRHVMQTDLSKLKEDLIIEEDRPGSYNASVAAFRTSDKKLPSYGRLLINANRAIRDISLFQSLGWTDLIDGDPLTGRATASFTADKNYLIFIYGNSNIPTVLNADPVVPLGTFVLNGDGYWISAHSVPSVYNFTEIGLWSFDKTSVPRNSIRDLTPINQCFSNAAGANYIEVPMLRIDRKLGNVLLGVGFYYILSNVLSNVDYKIGVRLFYSDEAGNIESVRLYGVYQGRAGTYSIYAYSGSTRFCNVFFPAIYNGKHLTDVYLSFYANGSTTYNTCIEIPAIKDIFLII